MEQEKIKDIISALAIDLDVDNGDIVYDDSSRLFIVDGCMQYRVFDTHDEAYDYAVDDIINQFKTDGIENCGIQFDMLGGINQFVSLDWFESYMEQSLISYIENIKNEYTGNEYEDEYGDTIYETRLDHEMKESRCDDEDEYLQQLMDSNDPVKWYLSNFGEISLGYISQNNDIIDYDKLAKAIVDHDSVASRIATYDGNEIILSNGMYAYRES